MVKLVAGISIIAGLVIGAIADSAAIGGEVMGGLFVIGLLIIIADAVQRMAPTPASASSPPDDSDLIEDVEFVFSEEAGELVEAPKATTGRRRR